MLIRIRPIAAVKKFLTKIYHLISGVLVELVFCLFVVIAAWILAVLFG